MLSPEQLQVVTTSSSPTAVEISGVCAAVQDQLGRGLAEYSHGQPLHGLPPAWQLTWHTQSTPVSPIWMVQKASPEGKLSGWYLLLCLCQCLRIKTAVELLC